MSKTEPFSNYTMCVCLAGFSCYITSFGAARCEREGVLDEFRHQSGTR